MSVGEWLDSVIAQSTQADELQNERPAEYDDEHAYSAEREYREQDRRARQRNALAQKAARPAINKEFEELHARLDHLTYQLSQVATLSVGNAARRNDRVVEC